MLSGLSKAFGSKQRLLRAPPRRPALAGAVRQPTRAPATPVLPQPRLPPPHLQPEPAGRRRPARQALPTASGCAAASRPRPRRSAGRTTGPPAGAPGQPIHLPPHGAGRAGPDTTAATHHRHRRVGRRRGRRYGTIIVDLERDAIAELLPDRDADTVADWLRRHPSVEIVARDRAEVYGEGVRQGAPGAVHVLDRWHVLRNLGEALQEAVTGQHSVIRSVARTFGDERAAALRAERNRLRPLYVGRPTQAGKARSPSGAPHRTPAPSRGRCFRRRPSPPSRSRPQDHRAMAV
ncbi:transposase [Methylobacterium tardum]|uniref:transposase n=1 Tax=Methylobacterium tardum TaxID=374432 RepID=UPI00360B88E6